MQTGKESISGQFLLSQSQSRTQQVEAMVGSIGAKLMKTKARSESPPGGTLGTVFLFDISPCNTLKPLYQKSRIVLSFTAYPTKNKTKQKTPTHA